MNSIRTTAGLVLLFADYARPDVKVVGLAAVRGGFSITHIAEAGGDGARSVELLVNGLTFDFSGVAPGPAAPLPAVRHRYGIEAIPLEERVATCLTAGSHLFGGESMIPVVRSQLALALCLAEIPGAVAVVWEPARSLMSIDYFRRVVDAWTEEGVFPALGLVGFGLAPDDGLHTEGLAFFTGQELRLEPELVEDSAQATKLAVRLLNGLVTQGPHLAPTTMAGPDGRTLTLEPSANGSYVRIGLGR